MAAPSIFNAESLLEAKRTSTGLRQTLHATLVGEPTGGTPSTYGEVKTLTLPNSKLVVQYTTKHFTSKEGAVPALLPDLSAPETLADALAGRDPAFEAVIAGSR